MNLCRDESHGILLISAFKNTLIHIFTEVKYMKKIISVIFALCFIMQTTICVSGAERVVKENEDIELPSTFASVVPNGEDTKKLPVEIKAKSAVLMDVATGKVLMQYNHCDRS